MSPQRPPCNPLASPAARALLGRLYEASGRLTLSGQHNFAGAPSRYSDELAALTGQAPSVWGCDFSFACEGPDASRYQHCGPLNLADPGDPFAILDRSPQGVRSSLVDEAIRRHQSGHLVTLMWHHLFPLHGDGGPAGALWTLERRPQAEEWENLTTPGTSLYGAWREQLQAIVPHLRRLRDAGVPVLWRPYHEMNGVWFWWGSKPGPEGFVRLWRNHFRVLVEEEQLHNLLWVWNANAPRMKPRDEAWPYREYYPGHAWVDVLAADVYGADYRDSHHDELLEVGAGRPIALGEVGNLPPPEILERQPRWAWFMAWGNLAAKWNSAEEIRRLYAHPRVQSIGSTS